MPTGKLAISRGHQLRSLPDESGPRLSLVPQPAQQPLPPAEAPPPATADYHLVHDRLTTLERLTRLLDQGALSPEEFAAEKAIVLALPAEELVLREPAEWRMPAAPARPPRGPSLLGRLFSWKFLPVGLVAGLGLSYAAQPDETLRFLDQLLSVFA